MGTIWAQKQKDALLTTAEEDGLTWVFPASMLPDWIRLPAELGGATERVVSAAVGRCPLCDRTVRHLHAETAHVAECRDCGFCWYRRDK
jgi:hypothetical protein